MSTHSASRCLLLALGIGVLSFVSMSGDAVRADPDEKPADTVEIVLLEPMTVADLLRSAARILERPIVWDPDDPMIKGRRVASSDGLTCKQSEIAGVISQLLSVHGLELTEGDLAFSVRRRETRRLVERRTIQLKYVEADMAAIFLVRHFEANGKPAIEGGLRIDGEWRSNQLIVAGPPLRVAAVREVVGQMDVAIYAQRDTVHVIALKHRDAAQMAALLSELIARSEFFGGGGQLDPDPVSRLLQHQRPWAWEEKPVVLADRPTRSLVVVATTRQLAPLQRLIEDLDITTDEE